MKFLGGATILLKADDDHRYGPASASITTNYVSVRPRITILHHILSRWTAEDLFNVKRNAGSKFGATNRSTKVIATIINYMG